MAYIIGMQGLAQPPDLGDPLENARKAMEVAMNVARTKNAPRVGAPESRAPGGSPGGPPPSAPRTGGRAPRKPSGWAVLDGVFGGKTFTESRRYEEERIAQQEAAQARAQRLAELREVVKQAYPDDPMAAAAFELDPEGFIKEYVERYGQDVVSEGSSVARDARFFTAPKQNIVGDRVVTSGVGPNGEQQVQVSAPVPPSFKDVSEDRARSRVTLADGADLVDAGPTASSVGPGAPDGDLWSRLIQQESGGNQAAVSPKGAFGRAQLMPDTAAQVARQLGRPELAELARTDPEVNELLGQTYLRQQQDRFGNDAVALAAYNAGPEKAAEWVQRFGMPQPGQELEWASRLTYPETRNYVQSILGGRGPARAGPPTDAPRIVASNPKASPAPPAGQQFNQERALRAGFGAQPAVKDLATIAPQIGVIGDIARKAEAYQRGEGPPVSAQDDLALIFSFMKVLDPGSVVREGEFANAQNTGGIPDRIRNAYNNALRGTRLNDTQRNEFFRTATLVMNNYTEGAANQADRARELAQGYGLDPDRVAKPIRRPAPRTKPAASKPAAKPAAPPASAPRTARVRRYNPATGKIE